MVLELRWVRLPRVLRGRRTACVNHIGGPTIQVYYRENDRTAMRTVVKIRGSALLSPSQTPSKRGSGGRPKIAIASGDQVKRLTTTLHRRKTSPRRYSKIELALANADFLESMAAFAVDQIATVGRAHPSPKALLARPLDLAIASWVMHSYLLRGAGARPIAPINRQTDETSQFIVSSIQRQPCFSPQSPQGSKPPVRTGEP